MNLVDLVNTKNSLRSGPDLAPLSAELDKITKHYQDIIRGVDPRFTGSVNISIDHYQTIKDQLALHQPKIEQTIADIDAEILKQSQKFFTESYALERELKSDFDSYGMLTQNLRTMRHWRNIRLDQTGSPDMHMLGVIRKHVEHRYPVLEIGCRDGDWTKFLVAGDPLYISDYTEEFMHNAVHQFTKQYIPRVRQYQIKDNNINDLPENQFGFVLSYNFFNYLAFDTIKQWMRKAHTWLRPGGIIMFTYNNADHGYGAAMAESSVQSYCPMSLLVPMCESIGLQYHDHRDYVNTPFTPMSWIQFKKPGELSTVKVAQALGQIKLYSET
jgi:SAM-dependent methyltransferase|tara:strand:+ start:389 stop:1372 length:984 start_codon:yes stop_codon:yes gene_type:complete